MARVLLLMATRTYRSKAFIEAARRLGVEVVVGSERRQALASRTRNTTVAFDFRRPDRAARKIAELGCERRFDAVIGVDDDTTVIAATASAKLGLPYNSVESVRAANDKYRTRRLLAQAGLPSPRFERLSVDDEPTVVAARSPYPCVLKPVGLAASRGVIRADDPAEFAEAFRRITAMLAADGGRQRHILVESFVAGPEVALEGLLDDGTLRVLALFDKPDPLDGPYFEETMYVTPSRLPVATQAAVAGMTARAAEVLGLRHGPIHAELRLGSGGSGPYVIEVAARTIGGLCSNALRFGTDASLEELIIRHAIGAEISSFERERQAAGAMMLPIPRGGVLRAVRGREEALAVRGVEDVTVTIPLGMPVVPLPEGDRYLGFVFARAETPGEVESALREAHGRLRFVITSPDENLDTAEWLVATPVRRRLPVLPAGAALP